MFFHVLAQKIWKACLALITRHWPQTSSIGHVKLPLISAAFSYCTHLFRHFTRLSIFEIFLVHIPLYHNNFHWNCDMFISVFYRYSISYHCRRYIIGSPQYWAQRPDMGKTSIFLVPWSEAFLFSLTCRHISHLLNINRF